LERPCPEWRCASIARNASRRSLRTISDFTDDAGHANWSNRYAVPGDESTDRRSDHGAEATVSAPGFGVIAHIAGLEDADEIHHGAFRFLDDPAVVARLCDALTA
jgi:hypothetical protein